jgi:hypothetical protein
MWASAFQIANEAATVVNQTFSLTGSDGPEIRSRRGEDYATSIAEMVLIQNWFTTAGSNAAGRALSYNNSIIGSISQFRMGISLRAMAVESDPATAHTIDNGWFPVKWYERAGI